MLSSITYLYINLWLLEICLLLVRTLSHSVPTCTDQFSMAILVHGYLQARTTKIWKGPFINVSRTSFKLPGMRSNIVWQQNIHFTNSIIRHIKPAFGNSLHFFDSDNLLKWNGFRICKNLAYLVNPHGTSVYLGRSRQMYPRIHLMDTCWYRFGVSNLNITLTLSNSFSSIGDIHTEWSLIIVKTSVSHICSRADFEALQCFCNFLKIHALWIVLTFHGFTRSCVSVLFLHVFLS